MPSRALPQLDEFRSATLHYRTGDKFNPPALTNFFGCLQAAPDILAVQHLTFPPYSTGESWLGPLTLNGCCLHTSGQPIEFRWRPDRIDRRWLDLFGLDFGYTRLGLKPQLNSIDPEAVLENVPYHGGLHRVTANPSVLSPVDRPSRSDLRGIRAWLQTSAAPPVCRVEGRAPHRPRAAAGAQPGRYGDRPSKNFTLQRV